MIEIPGKIPISIHPIFWLLAGLIGWLNSQGSLVLGLLWVAVVFVSVLFHEFGHALMAVAFRQKAKIALVAFGGVTQYDGPKLKKWQQFLIVFNGPFFGFLLFIAATFCLQFAWSEMPLLRAGLHLMQIANLFWTVVNLLPILPLDGGHLLRIVLEKFFGVRGLRFALFFGALFSLLLGLGFFLLRAYLAGALFFLFAYQGYQSWRQSRFASLEDEDDSLKKELVQAEIWLQQGEKERAKKALEGIFARAKGGLVASTAAQLLSYLYVEEGKIDEAYQLLLPLSEQQLSSESQVLLHDLAFRKKNYSLVAKISASCYQIAQTQEVALRNARAFAWLKEGHLAGGWLEAAWGEGGLSLESVLQEPCFKAISEDRAFKKCIEKMGK